MVQINIANEIDNDDNHANAPSAATIGQTAGQAVWIEPVYDAGGNATAVPMAYWDPNTLQTFVYDAWNRMVLDYEDVDSSGTYNAGDNAWLRRVYDGLNRFVRYDYGGDYATNGGWDMYYNTRWQLLETYATDTSWPFTHALDRGTPYLIVD